MPTTINAPIPINIAVSEVVSNTNQGKKTYNRVDLGVSHEK
jgi:uncharacterized protein (UPF0212 family)